jgi:hypothetical protein
MIAPLQPSSTATKTPRIAPSIQGQRITKISASNLDFFTSKTIHNKGSEFERIFVVFALRRYHQLYHFNLHPRLQKHQHGASITAMHWKCEEKQGGCNITQKEAWW